MAIAPEDYTAAFAVDVISKVILITSTAITIILVINRAHMIKKIVAHQEKVRFLGRKAPENLEFDIMRMFRYFYRAI